MPSCKKCDVTFPNRLVIDGKERNLGKRKYCLTCSPFGLHNTRPLTRTYYKTRDIRDATEPCCEICNRATTARRRARCPSCSANFRRYRLKARLIEYKGGKCVRCGYNKCSAALELHHRDPARKEFGFSGTHCKSEAVLKAEADKCDLVCANCHRELDEEIRRKTNATYIFYLRYLNDDK